MIVTFFQDAAASTLSLVNFFSTRSDSTLSDSAPPSSPPISPVAHGKVRHLLFGTGPDVRQEIAHLHVLGYADPNDWSRPISTGRANEVMAILIKRVSR